MRVLFIRFHPNQLSPDKNISKIESTEHSALSAGGVVVGSRDARTYFPTTVIRITV